MGRQDFHYQTFLPYLGINQQAEHATMEECADARNVWAPNGVLERRPGSDGVSFLAVTNFQDNLTLDAFFKTVSGAVTENAAGVLAVGGLPVGDKIYFGFTAKPTKNICLAYQMSAANTNATQFKLEYWNGSGWSYLPACEVDYTNFTTSWVGHAKFLGSANAMNMFFPYPQDWASTTVTNKAGTFYYLRVEILGTAIVAARNLTSTVAITTFTDDEHSPYITKLDFISGLQFASYNYNPGSTLAVVDAMQGRAFTANNHAEIGDPEIVLDGERGLEPPTLAFIPSEDRGYIAANYQVRIFQSVPPSADFIAVPAHPETLDFAVGPNAPYDPTIVAQLSAFPKPLYLQFFQGRLWAANLQYEPHTIRWSAAAPYHKVWPTLAYEYIMEKDSSPITGMSPLLENMIVYKQQSIYQMVAGQIDSFSVPHYIPRQIVSGIGCVSNSSIQSINGQHIFLAEDGLYSFNGVVAKKISLRDGYDRLRDTWASLTPSQRKFALGTHWRSKNCYLLAVAVNGSTSNNLVIVWDYLHDSFWLWDLNVRSWVNDDNFYGGERLCYVDESNVLYALAGTTDQGGTIDSYFKSYRFDYNDPITDTVRLVEVYSRNSVASMTVEITAEDGPSGLPGGSGTLVISDPQEAVYGTAQYGLSNYVLPQKVSKRLDFNVVGKWHQLKVSSIGSSPFEISNIIIGTQPLGVR